MRGKSKEKMAKLIYADQINQVESKRKEREFEHQNETKKDLFEARKIKEIYDKESND